LFEQSEKTINVRSPETKEVLNNVAERIGGDLFTTLGTLVSDLVQPVGFKIHRRELRPNQDGTVSTHAAQPLYVLDSRIRNANDIRIRYGSVYEFSVSAVYKMIIPFVGQAGQLLKKTVFVASEPSNMIRMIGEDFSPMQPVPGLELEAVRDENLEPSGVRLMWTHPPDIKGKIRGFRVYRRPANLREPFRLLREFQFRRPPRTHDLFFSHEVAGTRALSPNGPLVDLTENVDQPAIPMRSYHDTTFRNSEEFIYTITTIDMHGNESPCSDQWTLMLDDRANGTPKMISIRGAPLGYPNLYIDRRAIIDSKLANSIKRGRTKAVIFWDPVAARITNLDYRGQGIRTGQPQDVTAATAEALLIDGLNTFDAPVQLQSGRIAGGEQDGSDAFIFTADGSITFDGMSAEYDFVIFDETTLKTAIVRTNVKYGSDDDVEALFIE